MVLDLRIEKLVYGGDGLSRENGRVAFTPFVLPGERVSAEVIDERRGLLRTRLREVVEPAAQRVPALCPYFARCGGCHYQHAPYESQLEFKREILAETLRRIGKLTALPEIKIVSGEPWGYRNRSQFHIRGGQIGYLEAGSHKLCAVEQCPISSPGVNAALASMRRMIRDPRWPSYVSEVEVFSNEREAQLNILQSGKPVARRFFDWAAEELGNLAPGAIDYGPYRVSGGSFFQVNRFLIDALIQTALEGALGETALDLYAGVGLFSLPLARQVGDVTSVEAGKSAFRDLQFNIERTGAAVRAEQAPVEAFLESHGGRPDFVLLDPPRAGLGSHVVKRLLEIAPASIAIVACDPATLARDLQALRSQYKLESITLVDLFPQTFHMETVVRLRI